MTTEAASATQEYLHKLGIKSGHIEDVREYMRIRAGLGASIRSTLLGCAIALGANACMYSLFDEPSHAGVGSAASVILAYMPWVGAAVAAFSVGLFLWLYRTILALDKTMRVELGLSELAAAKFVSIARFSTWREALGLRVAALVVYGIGGEL